MAYNDKLFPNLRYDPLVSFAEDLASYYDFIQKITLYKARLNNRQNIRYLMVFHLPDDPGPKDEYLSMRLNIFKHFLDSFDGPPEFKGEDSFFIEVYRKRTKNCRNEWGFLTSHDDFESLSDLEQRWDLFDRDKRDTEKYDLPPCLSTISQAEPSSSEPDKVPAVSTSRVSPDKEIIEAGKEPESQYSFTKEGDFWRVRYGSETATIRDLKGIKYIAILLSKRHEFISCIKLYQAVNPTPTSGMTQDESIKHGLNTDKSRENNPQRKTTLAYKDKIKEQYYERERIESLPDHERTPEDEMSLQQINKELDALLKAQKETGNENANIKSKNAQSNINKSINIIYGKFKKNGLKNLTKHLKPNIKPDGEYGLSYSGILDWKISM